MNTYEMRIKNNAEVIDQLINIISRATLDVIKDADGMIEYSKTAAGLETRTQLVKEVVEHELIRQFGE